MEKNEVCVVTGGAGFIGSHLCEALLADGYTVMCLDNLLTGVETNLKHLKEHKNFSFLRWDVSKELPVFPRVDYVFHLASPASVPDYQKYDEETALVNSVGTRSLLKIARVYKAKFLYTSTSEVYGDPAEHPQKETYWGHVNPNGVRACYDEAKRFGEMMTLLYVRKHGVDARIVRIFNTYGPHMRVDDGRVISNFINQALRNNPLTVYGDGTQTRSFCYVSDMVLGITGAMFEDNTKGEVINLGNPVEYSMIDMAQKIKQMTGSTSEIAHEPLPEDDPIKRKPDITKASKLLGWKPSVDLEQGLQKTIEYYRSMLQ